MSKTDKSMKSWELFNLKGFRFPFPNQMKSKRDLIFVFKIAERKGVGGMGPRREYYRDNEINKIGGRSWRE